jgi:hypothetical protein
MSSIIDRYRENVSDPFEKKQRSKEFHRFFRLEVERAKLRGEITVSPQSPDFWEKWEALQES